jgi:signal peptidase I
MKNWKDYFETIIVAVFIALIVRTFIVTGYKVPTSSMTPTLIPGDFIFASRLNYGLKIPFSGHKLWTRAPDRGDVVVFKYPDQPRVHYVKRVIALPGDKVEIISGRLILNDEPWSLKQSTDQSLKQHLSQAFVENFEIFEESSGNHRRLISLQKQQGDKNFGPLIVPPNEVFLLGDHRDSSDDSRYWGTVPIESIEAHVFVVWLSLDWLRKSSDFFRWHRVGTRIH